MQDPFPAESCQGEKSAVPPRGEERGSGGWIPHSPLVPESSAFSKTVTTANTGWDLGTPGHPLYQRCCPNTLPLNLRSRIRRRRKLSLPNTIFYHGPHAEDADGLSDTKKLLSGLLQARGLGNDHKAWKVSSNI